MGIVDKVMGSLSSNETRTSTNQGLHSGATSGPEALADGRPSHTTIDDKIGGTHTRNVKDAVTHENVSRHAHHEVTPEVQRTRDEVDVHQKIQPVYDEQKQTTYHQHEAPAVHRERGEDITEDHARKYAQQAQHENTRNIGDQTHSTSVNAPKVHEHVNKHIIEEIQPVIERQTQQTEHHHTTQHITEHFQHAPRIHDTTVNKPIHISEFTQGGGAGIGGSHGARDVITDTREGSHSGSGLTGSHGTHSGSHTGTGSGLTGNSSHTTGSGLTGSHANQGVQDSQGSGLTGSHLTGDNYNNKSTGSGLTGNHNSSTGSGVTGTHGNNTTTGTHGTQGTEHKETLLEKAKRIL